VLGGEAGGRRRRGGIAALLIVLACALVVAPVANAELFTVDSTADEADISPGAGGCLTASGKCTLRAAIQESNSSVDEADEIVFDETIFDGQAAGSIALSSSLPAIVEPGRVNGHECPTAAGVSGPCVGIEGPAAGTALSVENGDGVEIEGIAVTGAKTGIAIESSALVRVRSSWFGVKLDGSAGGNETGVLVGPGSEADRIGGEGPEAGNLFAHSAGDGLHIHGASEIRVLGNRFGVGPDGGTLAANGKDIEITSAPLGAEATGNTIGTMVTRPAAATPACDGGCNLISGAASAGVDLEGDGGAAIPDEAPAVDTTIAGNHIGLDASGTAAIPNVQGIHVGAAKQTLIGGSRAGSANRITGGGVAVSAGPSATDVVVRGNLIGGGATGDGILAPPNVGIAVNSKGLSNPFFEAVIADNEIRMQGGCGIVQRGLGALIAGNEIFGAETGIFTAEASEEHGNLIQGNRLEALELTGILVENDRNEIRGNEIFGIGDAGVRINGSPGFPATENLVGGDGPGDENVIAGAGGDAIEISDLETTQNEVARNHGSGNGGLFIDLVAFAPLSEPNGPNEGIEPPGFSTATPESSTGSAEPGARVRVFGKRVAEAGEIESFLGEAVADAGGHWSVLYAAAIPAGTIVAATQTSEAGGTSELALATTSGESGGGNGGGTIAKAPGNLADSTPPQTRIVMAKSHRGTARFRFESDQSGSTFQCRLDGKPFAACRSPKRYGGLKPGKHAFQVRAIDAAGNVDSSPAKRRFAVRP
jgi:CSLREA domain-containing protein